MSQNQSYYTVMLVTGSLQLRVHPCCYGARESEEWKILFKNTKRGNYTENEELYWW